MSFRLRPSHLLAAFIIVLCAIPFVFTFNHLYALYPDLAIDLDIRQLQNWHINYTTTTLMNPPWSLIFLLPLGAMSEASAWGMMAYLTVLAVFINVPKVSKLWLYLVLVLLAHMGLPTLRSIIDANTEFMIPLGVALCLWGYRYRRPWLLALGALIATNKPQSVILFIAVLGAYTLWTWRPSQWLRALGWALLAVIPSLILVGPAWLEAMFGIPTQSSIMDSSLVSSLNRTGAVSNVLITILRVAIAAITLGVAYITGPDLSTKKAGFLIAAGLLVSPYAAGNSALAIYAIAAIPLLVTNRWQGVVLVTGANLLYFAFLGGYSDWLFQYSAYYWTGYFLVSWMLLGSILLQENKTATEEV